MTEPGKRWTVTVEPGDTPDELVMPLPEAALAWLGWKAGDQLRWHQNEEGAWVLSKVDE